MENSRHTFTISSAAEELVPNRDNRNAYLLALIISLVLAGASMAVYARLPDRVPLLLTEPWGEGRLVPKPFIYGGSILIVMVVAVNIALSRLWSGEGVLIQRILSVAALIFAGSMTLAYWGLLQSYFL